MVGLAQDYCVAWTSLDSLELGLPTTVLTDHTRPVDPRSGEKMMEVPRNNTEKIFRESSEKYLDRS